MPIIACGINHKTAPIELREQVVFQADKLALYLQDLTSHEDIREAVLLSTCNRSELYCDTDNLDNVLEWFSRQHQVSLTHLKSVWYCYQGQAAVEHIMKVACGLDSMVLGEPQILGQMKDAFSESCAAGSIGPQFNRLFQQVFSVAKEIRTNTSIGACPVSMASAAVNLAKRNYSNDFSAANILLIGAGDTISLVLRYLKSQNIQRVIIANRHAENAQMLASTYGYGSISFQELPDVLADVDILISATGSPAPIVTKNMFQVRMKPIVMIDLAVPRDIEPAVNELEHVSLYSIDDLRSLIEANVQGREHAAEKASEVIQTKCSEFMMWLHSIDKVGMTISAFRKQIEDICQMELSKSTRQLERGDCPTQVLTSFAYSITNKLLHTPSVQLRQAGVEGRLDLLQLAQELFAIPKMQA